jgi:hypothetical protein
VDILLERPSTDPRFPGIPGDEIQCQALLDIGTIVRDDDVL